jgi:hypothetical protein
VNLKSNFRKLDEIANELIGAGLPEFGRKIKATVCSHYFDDDDLKPHLILSPPLPPVPKPARFSPNLSRYRAFPPPTLPKFVLGQRPIPGHNIPTETGEPSVKKIRNTARELEQVSAEESEDKELRMSSGSRDYHESRSSERSKSSGSERKSLKSGRSSHYSPNSRVCPNSSPVQPEANDDLLLSLIVQLRNQLTEPNGDERFLRAVSLIRENGPQQHGSGISQPNQNRRHR